MEINYTVLAQLILDYDPKINKNLKLLGVNTALDASSNLDLDLYVNDDGSLTADGVTIATKVLVNGINAVIQYAHQTNIKDSAVHLREVIKELESLFVLVTEHGPGHFE